VVGRYSCPARWDSWRGFAAESGCGFRHDLLAPHARLAGGQDLARETPAKYCYRKSGLRLWPRWKADSLYIWVVVKLPLRIGREAHGMPLIGDYGAS
jgi:hypothetical protein